MIAFGTTFNPPEEQLLNIAAGAQLHDSKTTGFIWSIKEVNPAYQKIIDMGQNNFFVSSWVP